MPGSRRVIIIIEMLDTEEKYSGTQDGFHTFADTLCRVDLGAIRHDVDGEVDLGDGLLPLYGTDGIVDLPAGKRLGRAGRCCTAAVVLVLHIEVAGKSPKEAKAEGR